MSTAIKTETSHLIWSPKGKPVSIHVNPRILARLRPGLSPPTGERVVERGGLLLGYAREIGERWLIAVEDSREIRTGYQRGESWVIGPAERRALQSVMRQWSRERRGDHPYVVGWYRTHTRPGLYLDESDFRFFLEYFPPPANVALTLSQNEGGFFFWEEGEIRRSRPYETFALPEAPPGAVEVVRTSRYPVFALSGLRRAWLAIPVVAGLAVGMFWNPDPLRRPTAARVAVTEIPASEPSEPRAVFAPPPAVVEQQVEEKKPLVASTVPAPTATRARAVAPEPVSTARRVRKLQVPPTRITAAEPEMNVDAPMVAATSRDHLPVIPQTRDPMVETRMEPAKPSAIRRVVGSIPGLGFIKKKKASNEKESYTPPRAVREVRPISPAGLTVEVPVRVRVLLNSDGEIEKTELLTRKVEPAIARAAVDAAQNWRFEPARVDEKPVASELVVQFLFPAAKPGGGS